MDWKGLFSVEGKVVLVTGGAGGIGRGIAGGFVAHGAKVYIASRKDISAAAAELSKEGPGECIAVSGVDVAKDADIARLVKIIEEKEGKLDVLVNNAGITGAVQKFEDFPMDSYDETIAVNVRGPFALTKECLPLLTKAGEGKGPNQHATVINIASIDGIRITAVSEWAYGPGKAALIHFTKMMGGRYGNRGGGKGGRNITFNAIAPGPFPGMMDEVIQTEEGRKSIERATSVGRVGEVEDMGAACIYLASRAGAFVTGTVLTVDGGLLVGRSANL